MTDIDDRAEFERNKREKSVALGQDQELVDVGYRKAQRAGLRSAKSP